MLFTGQNLNVKKAADWALYITHRVILLHRPKSSCQEERKATCGLWACAVPSGAGSGQSTELKRGAEAPPPPQLLSFLLKASLNNRCRSQVWI